MADDDQLLLELTERALARRGHDVHVFADGEAAALAFEDTESRYDVAIIDLHMPGRSGLEVLAAARRAQPATRVIMASCSWKLPDREAAERGGAFRVLEKPIGLADLYDVVDAAMRESARRRRVRLEAPTTVRAKAAGAVDEEQTDTGRGGEAAARRRTFIERPRIGAGEVIENEAAAGGDGWDDGTESSDAQGSESTLAPTLARRPTPPLTARTPLRRNPPNPNRSAAPTHTPPPARPPSERAHEGGALVREYGAAACPPPVPLDDELSPSGQIEAILQREREAARDLETPQPVHVELVPPRVLLLEPDRSLANLVGYCLRRQGYRVETRSSVAALRATIEEAPPDLLVAEIGECAEQEALGPLLERLRGRYGTEGPPVIVLYPQDCAAIAVHALDAGADVAISRPYEPDLLFAHVRALLRRFGAASRRRKETACGSIATPLNCDAERTATGLRAALHPRSDVLGPGSPRSTNEEPPR